jgi:hypothetical protein
LDRVTYIAIGGWIVSLVLVAIAARSAGLF